MPHNPEQKSAYQRQWRRDNSEYVRAKDFAYGLRYLYGLDLDAYIEMVLAQEGRCGSCGVYMTYKTRANTQCTVDHDHQTGKVRSLLCSECNKKLGFIESPDFDRLQRYLVLHQRPTVPVSD